MNTDYGACNKVFLVPSGKRIPEGAIRAQCGLRLALFCSLTAKNGTLLHMFLKDPFCLGFRQNGKF